MPGIPQPKGVSYDHGESQSRADLPGTKLCGCVKLCCVGSDVLVWTLLMSPGLYEGTQLILPHLHTKKYRKCTEKQPVLNDTEAVRS